MERASYVPDLKWRVNLQTELTQKLVAGLSLVYTGERTLRRSDGQIKAIADVCELGFRLTARFSSSLTCTLIGSDLTDQKRPDQFGFSMDDYDYPTPGRRNDLKATLSLR